MPKKPAGLIYDVDDKPPLSASALLGLQHVFVMAAGWVMVVVIVTTVGGIQEEVANVLRMSMIASGIATILQALPHSLIGSGYFCPISGGPAYISTSILAGKAGGLRSVFFITMISGLFGLAHGKIAAEVSFDEFNLDIDVRYDGELMELPTYRPTENALFTDEKAVVGLSGFLIRQYADRVKADTANGRRLIQMHFEH